VGGPGAVVAAPANGSLTLRPRLAAVIGADGAIAGLSAYADWRAPHRAPPKDRDFGAALGPVVATADALIGATFETVVRVNGEERLHDSLGSFDWESARELAAEGTVLRPGELLVSPAAGELDGVGVGASVELDVTGIGVLTAGVEQSQS